MKRASMRVHMPDFKKNDRFSRSRSKTKKSPRSSHINKPKQLNPTYGSEAIHKTSKNSSLRQSKRNHSPRFEKKRTTVNFVDSKNSSK